MKNIRIARDRLVRLIVCPVVLTTLAISTTRPANAGNVTYTYAGRPYSPTAPTFCNGTYTATCSQLAVTGYFTVANALAPNLSNYTFTPLQFSFADGGGVFSLTSGDELAVSTFQVTTDRNGNIVFWSIVLATVSSTGCLVDNELIGTYSSQFNGQSGDYSCYLYNQDLPTQAFGAGQNSSTPGRWNRAFSVDPRGSYIFVNTVGGGTPSQPPDEVVAPLVINLAAIGFTAGDVISTAVLGDFSYSCYPNVPGSCVLQPGVLCGVFSSSSVVLPPGTPTNPTVNRVPGAIAPDFNTVAQCITPPTLFGGYPTDIPQDFFLNDAVVTIPPGAGYLIVAVADSFYADNADPDGTLAIQIIASSPPSSQSITQPLSPTAPNQFQFDKDVHNFTVQYPAGTSFSGVNMTVVAAQTSELSFLQRVAGTQFANALCIVYEGEEGYCEDYQVSCTDTSGNSIACPSEPTASINVKTSYDTLQQITNPGFLTAPIGTNDWTNIFTAFYLQRIDPTTRGRTAAFSEFFAVDLGTTDPQGAATLQFEDPLQQSDARIFPAGTTIPVKFQLASIAHPGTFVTDAVAGIALVMVADAQGNPAANVMLENSSAFTFSGGNYSYSLNTTGYAPGTYNMTAYGNAFAAQQVQFTIPPPTTGAHLVTTLQSLTLNSSNQYVVVLAFANPGTTAANGLLVTAAQLNGTSTSTALPLSVGDLGSGATATETFAFPASAGAAGSRGVLNISLSYAGGTAGAGFRVTLP